MNPADLFRQDANPVLLNAGDKLFSSGDEGHEMFVLVEGAADILVGSEVVESAQAGALLGEMALIENAPRVATVVATSACRLARIDQRRFQYLIQQNPFFATHVMKVLVERLRHMNERLGKD